MIPKKCHLIWTKGVPMSWLQTLTVGSFARYNPDWEITIYLIKEVKGINTFVPDYKGEDYFGKISCRVVETDLNEWGIKNDKHGILASDQLRMKLLYKYGGVYSDFDMLWLRPLFTCDFETTVCYYKDHYNMSNIVSEPGGSFIKEIIEKQDKVIPPYTHQAFLTELFNREYPNPDDLVKRFPRVKLIPYKWFYPYSIYTLEELYKSNIDCTSESYGVHWFNGHKLSQEYLKDMVPCSLTSILKREGYVAS